MSKAMSMLFSKKVWLVLLPVILLDQATKYAASSYLILGKPVPIIADFFSLTLVHNPGAAFGLFSGLAEPYRQIALILVSALALGAVAYFLIVEACDDCLAQIALIGILAGAIGNIIDRMRFDYVIDFLDFYWRDYHWPAFNVADSAISMGVCFLLFRWSFGDRAKERKIDKPAEDQLPGNQVCAE